MNWWDAIRGFLLEQSLIFRSYQALEWSVLWMQIWRLSNYYAVSHQKSVYDVYDVYVYNMCTIPHYACLLKSRGLFQPREDPELWRTWCNRSKKILSSKISKASYKMLQDATRCYKMLQDATSKKRTESFGKWPKMNISYCWSPWTAYFTTSLQLCCVHCTKTSCYSFLKSSSLVQLDGQMPACPWWPKVKLWEHCTRKKCYDPFQQRSPNLAELGASSAVVLWDTLWNSKNNSRCLSLAGRTTMSSIS